MPALGRRFDLAFCLYQKLLSFGPVNTWMGDFLQAGTSSQYVTSCQGQLSLLPSMGW